MPLTSQSVCKPFSHYVALPVPEETYNEDVSENCPGNEIRKTLLAVFGGASADVILRMQ